MTAACALVLGGTRLGWAVGAGVGGGSPGAAAAARTGEVSAHAFYSDSLKRRMRYLVYLPPGYDDPENGNVRYPVVYLLQGTPGRPEEWVDQRRANVAIDGLQARGKTGPMILVMVQGNLDDSTGEDELDAGPPGVWARYVARDLVSHVDGAYRTIASREGWAIAGLSEGGYAATNLGLKNPSEFAVIGSFSGYFEPFPREVWRADGRGEGGSDLEDSPVSYLPSSKGPLSAVYAYVGADDDLLDLREQNMRFGEMLKGKGGLDYEFHVFPGGHEWDLWRSRLPGFLEFADGRLEGARHV